MIHKILGLSGRLLRRPRIVLSIFSILTFLLCFNFYFGFKVVDTANSIDGSWQYTLSSLRHSDQALGIDVFFNYGPLFEHSLAYVHGNDTLRDFISSNLLLTVIFLLCCISIVMFIKHWVPSDKRGYAYVGVVLSYILLTINQIDTLFFIIALTGLLAIRREPRLWMQLPLLLGLQLFSFYKFSLSLYLIILTPIALFVSFKKSDLLQTFRRWAIFMGMYFLGYMALTGDLSIGFGKYLYYGLINSLYYNEFMSLPIAQNKWLLLIIICTAVGITALLAAAMCRSFLLKNYPRRWDTIACLLLVLATVLILFKHAAIRNDGHLLALSPVLILPLVSFVALTQNKIIIGKHIYGWFAQSIHVIIALIVVWVAALGFHWYAVSYFTHKGPVNSTETQLNQFIPSIAHNRFNYAFYDRQVKLAAVAIENRAPEIAIINEQLSRLDKDKKILFYGNTTMFGALLEKHYDVLYVPFLQHYSAHPPSLFDDIYINFLREHPDALIFAEENEPSIDKRIPAHELNNFFQYIHFNYRPIASDPVKRQYTLQRISDKQEVCEPYKTTTGTKPTLTTVPPLPEGQEGHYIKLKIQFPFNPIEKLIASAIKTPFYSIHLHTPGGAVMTMHTTEATLKHGVAINPLYISLHEAIVGDPFELKGITVQGGIQKNASYQAQFELCRFR